MSEQTASLETLLGLQKDRKLMQLEFEKLQQSIKDKIPPEVQKELSDLNEEFEGKMATINDRIFAAENAVKGAVLASKATIKIDGATATFIKPRVTWDTSALEGYSKAHPEILEFKKVGEPSVRISVDI